MGKGHTGMQFEQISKVIIGNWGNLSKIGEFVRVEVEGLHNDRQSDFLVPSHFGAISLVLQGSHQSFILRFQMFQSFIQFPLRIGTASHHFAELQSHHFRLL